MDGAGVRSQMDVGIQAFYLAAACYMQFRTLNGFCGASFVEADGTNHIDFSCSPIINEPADTDMSPTL